VKLRQLVGQAVYEVVVVSVDSLPILPPLIGDTFLAYSGAYFNLFLMTLGENSSFQNGTRHFVLSTTRLDLQSITMLYSESSMLNCIVDDIGIL